MQIGKQSLRAVLSLLLGMSAAAVAWAAPAYPDRPSLERLLVRLQSEEIDVYLAARRGLQEMGPRCRPAVLELEKQLTQKNDLRNLLRVRDLLRVLGQEEPLRSIEEGYAQAKALSATWAKKKTATVTLLLSRDLGEKWGLGDFRRADDYRGMCYFSFTKKRHGYDGEVSLEFGNGGDGFGVQMYGGQESSLVDLGEVDYDKVAKAPKAGPASSARAEAVVGHVYAEHHLESKDEDLGGYKFKVLALQSGCWAIVVWEPVPVAK